MRKCLSVVTAAIIFACAISPAAVWAEEPATAETTVTTEETTENDIETLDLDEQDAPAVYGAPPTPTTTVATINEQSFTSLQDAIDAAKDGQEIVLQSDVALTTGLKFSGTADAPINQWKNFIINANGKNLTLTELGMHAKFCNVTIKNCPELTISASKNPGETGTMTANYFGKASLILDKCDKVIISNDNQNPCGSGLCIYDGGDLYIQNNTHFTVKGFMDNGASGIYMDREDGIYKEDGIHKIVIGNIVVSGNSTLEATNCYHSGITANPVDITIRDHSELNVHDNNKDGSGEGGLSSYFGKLSVEESSRVVSQNNTAMQYSIYVHDLYVDGTSEIDASYNGFYDSINWRLGGYGLAFSGTGTLKSGAKVTATGNWGPGVDVAYYYHFDEKNTLEYEYEGSLIVEDGATISACRNYNRGLANEGTLTINSGANVYLNENLEGGLDNYPYATATVKNGANLVITGNGTYGIKNGNAGSGDGSEATLTLGSGTITDNNKASTIPYHKGGALVVPYHRDYGGGIYNENGHVTLYTTTKVYNNHAEKAGDDLYNAPTTGNYFTITNKAPGAKWCLLDIDQKIIDDWYKDEEGPEKRWREDNAINNTDIELPPSAALKAAHGAVAPTPSPSPTPDPTATPVPTNEPSAVPTAAPIAPVTRVDATATPAPTDAPTQQPTTAPTATAQPTATIPQTGDAAPLALFGGLTISSAAAFYFLRKRRKSE